MPRKWLGGVEKFQRLSTAIKTKILKALKKVPVIKNLEGWAKNHIGSRDYKAASPVMKQVLVQTVNEDLSEDAKKIKAPTILIYGDYDSEVPKEDTLEYERLINIAKERYLIDNTFR